MNVIRVLEDVLEGGVIERHASDPGPHVGGELALPQGHHDRRAARALKLRAQCLLSLCLPHTKQLSSQDCTVRHF